MSDPVMVKIGKMKVDFSRPCDVATALKALQIELAGGDRRETVRFDGEEITFQRGNDARLQKLITQYEGLCAKSGNPAARTRHAMKIRFTR